MTEMDQHWPRRPSWDCLCCGKPWPCDPAREGMAAEDAVSRNIYLSIQLKFALEELPRRAGRRDVRPVPRLDAVGG